MAKIENTIKDTTELNNKLLNAINLFRLNHDFNQLTKEIEKNKTEEVSSKSNIFEKAAKNIKNELKTNKLEKLQKNLDETIKLLNELSNKNISYDELLKMIDKSFNKDETSKLLFSISLVLEDKEYFYESESEASISMMLWEDVSYLENLKKEFKANYIKISSTNITSNKTLLLGASACASFVSSLTSAPSFINNLAVSNVNQETSTIGMLVALGLTKDLMYNSMNTDNKNKIKEYFSNLTLEDVSYVYSVKLLLLDFILKTNKDFFSNYMNDLISLTNDLKCVSLTNTLINNKNKELNEKIIDAFYRFEKDLIKKYSK